MCAGIEALLRTYRHWNRAPERPGAQEPAYLLTVEVPQPSGQMQDLVVASVGLTTIELLTIISQGLS